MSDTAPTVLIAGAGPTGLMAALELARFQIPVRIIDKLQEPAATSRAIGVQARTLELLEMRGLADQLVQRGVPASGGDVHGGGKRVAHLDFRRVDSRYNYVLFVPQTETERILREALQPSRVKVEFGVELAALKQDDSSITAILHHKDGGNEEVHASYLIDAEGAHSIVRATLGLGFQGKTFDQNYLLADLFADSELSGTDFHIFSSEHGFLALFPMGNRRFRLIADRPINASQSESPSLDECQAIYDQRSYIPARLHEMQWSSYFRINSRMVSRLRVGRVFFGGDAAHIHSPAGAQGMNTGMQDMINLGWKLAYVTQGYAARPLLDTYETDRLPVIRTVLRGTEGLTDLVASANPLVRAIFNHVTPLIAGTDFGQENAAAAFSQLAINYHGSPLSADNSLRRGIRAGDRLPDVPVKVVASSSSTRDLRDGQTARLLDVLDPSRFTLLYATGAASRAHLGRLEDLFRGWSGHPSQIQFLQITEPQNGDREPYVQTFHESGQPLVYLIRPDGYVAYRGHEGASDLLDAYIKRWLVGRQPAFAGGSSA